MVMVRGDVAAVQAAVAAGVSGARFSGVDSFVVADVHEAGVRGPSSAAGGAVAAVQAAVAAGVSGARFSVIDSFVIPNLHEAVFPALSGATKVEALEALGIVESFSVASLIEGADAAVKTANVQLIEIRLAMALGGKAFVTMTGDVAAVESAVDAAAQVVGQKGMLVNKVVIPHPRPELLNEMI